MAERPLCGDLAKGIGRGAVAALYNEGDMNMCDWCDENGGEPLSCQNCGRMICWDHEGIGDDVISRPYVTASGDVYCVRCGSRVDEEEEDAIEEEYDGWDFYAYGWYDEDMDFENEDANGVTIMSDFDDDDLADGYDDDYA